jgi:hypothetical protein
LLAPSPIASIQQRTYNFASTEYHEAIANLPTVNADKLRSDAIEFVDKFNPQKWYEDPVCTYVNGQRYEKGDLVNTVDAFNAINGKMVRDLFFPHHYFLIKLAEALLPCLPHCSPYYFSPPP